LLSLRLRFVRWWTQEALPESLLAKFNKPQNLHNAMSTTTETQPLVAEDRTVAILSYITLIGFIIAIVLHSSKKTQLGAFHLRQVLGLFVTGFIFGLCAIVLVFIPIIGWLAIFAGWVTLVTFVIMGLIAAVGGKQKPVPLLGKHYQKWFGTTFT
jgi:uncharacterized membrane protein